MLVLAGPAHGALRGGGHRGDVGGDAAAAVRGERDVAAHLVGGRGLLLDRGGDRGLVVVDPRDDRADLADRLDRAAGVGLDRLDPAGDVLGGPGGLLGQVLDLAGDHREALAGVAGPGRLDGGVEREQVGLLGDRGDQLDHVADLGRTTRRAAP